MRCCEALVEPVNAFPERPVASNTGHKIPSDVRPGRFGTQNVEGVLKSTGKGLVGPDRLHERAVRRSLTLQVGMKHLFPE